MLRYAVFSGEESEAAELRKVREDMKPGSRLINIFKAEDGESLRRALVRSEFTDISVEKDEESGLYLACAKRPGTVDERKRAIGARWGMQAPSYNVVHVLENDPANLGGWKAMILEILGEPEGKKLLDIGTGTGFLSIMAAEMGYETTAVDYTSEMLGFARENAKNRNVRIDFLQADGDHLPFDDGTFDFVVNSRVLWTCVDPVASIKEWKRVLKDGGLIASFHRISLDTQGGGENTAPLSNGTPSEFLKAFRDAGLEDVYTRDFGPEFDLIAGPPWHVFVGRKGRD